MMHCVRPKSLMTNLLLATKMKKTMKIILVELQLLELIREQQEEEPRIRTKWKNRKASRILRRPRPRRSVNSLKTSDLPSTRAMSTVS